MPAYIKYVLLFILLLTRPSNLTAQPFPELRFQSLSDKDGLSNNTVTTITQDKIGFIWFGTNNGLNRFDGYRFKPFYHDEKDSNSLPDNNITQIVPDKKNNLWISTKQGLSYFNTVTQICTNFTHNPNDSTSIRNDGQPFIYRDSAGNTWVTTYEGLYRFDKNLLYNEVAEGVEGFQFYQNYYQYYYSIVPDKKGQLWSFNANRIYLLDAGSKKVKKTFVCPVRKTITCVYFDSDNRMWVNIDNSGLFEFNEAENKLQFISFADVEMNGTSIIEWKTDNKKYLVVSTNNHALILLDPLTMQYRVYQKNAINKNYFASSYIQYLFVDRQNILWLATADGISYVTPSSRLSDIIAISPPPQKKNDRELSTAVANSFLPDESGNWLSTWHWEGIYRFDKNWRLKKYMPNFLCSEKVQQAGYNSTAYFFLRYKNEIYCTTDSGMFAIDTGNYRTRLFYPDDIKKYPVDLRNIIPVSERFWWIRSIKYGIYVFDIVEKKFIKHYQYTKGCTNCLPQAFLRWLLQTPNGTMYATSEDGLYEYRPATDDFIGYKRNEKDSISFPTNHLNGAAVDNAGKLWIATDKGICVFNTVSKKVEKVFSENKTIGFVLRVCVDDYQNVWFSNADGTWCWLRKKDRLVHFSTTEEMPKNNGTGLLVNGNDGSIYSGCFDAVLKFYPKKMMTDTLALRTTTTAVTEVTVNDMIVPFITNTINEKSIEILPFQNSFAVDFAVLNYDGIKDNLYYYRLIPSNKVWVQNSNGHLVFNSLPAGTYRLEVKGGNKISGDFAGTDFLIITVQPHWWQSWWCKLLFILCAAVLVTYFVKQRIKIIRKEGAVKQKIAAMEMQALRAQMNPHFIFNSLNSIENFMMKNEKRIAIDYLSKFALLIRMILDSSRNELVPFTKDMEALKLYIELEQFRYNNKFGVAFNIDPILLNGDYRVPPLLIQPFVENAVAHGLSKSNKDNLQLLVTAIFENDYILYTILDNGIGREKSALYAQQNRPFHKSMGMQITHERISVFNEQQNAKCDITVTDLYTENKEACGTKVQVKLKAI